MLSFPRVRGDVPGLCGPKWCGAWFSPRARGCSGENHGFLPHRLVFPACAGMFRGCLFAANNHRGFPRVRGDVPGKKRLEDESTLFSPRARGCSCLAPPPPFIVLVFPACAGMFLPSPSIGGGRVRFPRVRGDVPIPLPTGPKGDQFSPRARGCSW